MPPQIVCKEQGRSFVFALATLAASQKRFFVQVRPAGIASFTNRGVLSVLPPRASVFSNTVFRKTQAKTRIYSGVATAFIVSSVENHAESTQNRNNCAERLRGFASTIVLNVYAVL